MTSFFIIYEYTFFRRSQTSKAATPKKVKKASLAELARSPATSAEAWRSSIQEGLKDPVSKPRLVLDDTVFSQLLTTPERKIKDGKNSLKTKLVLNENSKVSEIQKEKCSGLNVSTGRVSLWL